MSIKKEKIEELEKEISKFLNKKDLLEKFIKGWGSGGQKTNKSSNCVYLKHIPSGIEVKCQKSRYREENRFFARRYLLNEIKKEIHNIPNTKDKATEKIRKAKKRRRTRANKKYR